MLAYQVNDMTCGHCVSAITKALKWVDPSAEVHIDLASRRVEVSSSRSSSTELREAIEATGYTPIDTSDLPSPSPSASSPEKTGGCCCG